MAIISLKRGAINPPDVPKPKKPKFWLWSIERDDNGQERWFMLPVSDALDFTELYTTADHHMKFVSDNLVVYMVSEEKPRYTIKQMQAFLQGWKAGTWVKGDPAPTRLSITRGERIK